MARGRVRSNCYADQGPLTKALNQADEMNDPDVLAKHNAQGGAGRV